MIIIVLYVTSCSLVVRHICFRGTICYLHNENIVNEELSEMLFYIDQTTRRHIPVHINMWASIHNCLEIDKYYRKPGLQYSRLDVALCPFCHLSFARQARLHVTILVHSLNKQIVDTDVGIKEKSRRYFFPFM